MAISNFVPEIWSARLLVALRNSHVAGNLVNRDYEGDITRAGDTVHITNLVAPTIGNYTSHSDITIEDVDDDGDTLVIDQQKYFAFEVDDVEKAQAAGNVLEPQLDAAAYGLRDVADKFLLDLLADGVQGTGNDLGTIDVSGDGGNALVYDTIVDLGVVLDESNVPQEGRFVVVPPSLHGRLLKDDRFVAAGDEAGAAARASGYIGRVNGLEVFKSNNMPTVTDTNASAAAIAGYRGAATYAEQILSVEAGRMEKRFADFVKGLHVYGAKVVRPSGLATAEFDTTSGS